MKKKILFIGSISPFFSGTLSLNLKNRGYECDALTIMKDQLHFKKISSQFENYYYLMEEKPKSKFLFYIKFLKRVFGFILKTKKPYDIIHIHSFVDPKLPCLLILFLSTKKRILTIYGSDFYQISQKNIILLKMLFFFKKLDVLNFTNETTKIDFYKFFKLGNLPFQIIRFGLPILDNLKNNNVTFPVDKDKNLIYLAIGYNRSKAQNHLKIMEEIVKLPKEILNHLFILFQFTYGQEDEKYKNLLIQLLENSKLPYFFLEGFQSEETIAGFRKLTDIMIHLPISDQFSGSFQENLFLGNIVITGTWLPYKTLKEKGVFFIEIDSIEEVKSAITESVLNSNQMRLKAQNNSLPIWELSSWQSNILNWEELYI